MEDYRKKYEKKLDLKIPRNYVIHHIDFNRENNDIHNLVMLPRELHNKYHNLASKILKTQDEKIEIKLKGIFENGHAFNYWYKEEYIKMITEFIDVYYKAQKYVDYRDYLLGYIPNIHFMEDLDGNI